jgi:hypothetical protein
LGLGDRAIGDLHQPQLRGLVTSVVSRRFFQI